MFSFFKRKLFSKNDLVNADREFNCTAIAMTDVGEIRKSNEDKIVFIQPHDENVLSNKGSLAIVCDGMGGHNSGELASKIGIQGVSKYYYKSKANIAQSIREAMVYAHKEIISVAKRNPKHARMGTTCTAVVILEKSLTIGHAGDSRAYLISPSGIRQLTKDHTYVQHLYEKGVITDVERNNHPDRNIVTMVLGTQNEFIPEVYAYEYVFGPDDILMICSDGLYDYISDKELLQILIENNSTDAAELLIDTAKMRGGHDNISVGIVRNKYKSINKASRITKEIN